MTDFNYPKICPICRADKSPLFIRNFIRGDIKYSLYECPECKVQFWLPKIAVAKEWYEEKGNPYRIRDLTELRISRGYHKLFLKRYKDSLKGKKLLDLGCGTGEFLAEVEKRGCEVFGLDFDREAIKIAKKRFNLKNIYAMSFEEFFQKENMPKFNMITFFEVIEHLPDPADFILNVKKLLKPSGKIVLSAPFRKRMLPNMNSWDFPPHHFTRWNKEAILNLFSKEEFSASFISYIEEFKILSESIDSIFKTGLVSKSLELASVGKKSLLLPKILYFSGRVKHFFLGKIPAVFLWLWSKISRKNNGIIYVEIEKA